MTLPTEEFIVDLIRNFPLDRRYGLCYKTDTIAVLDSTASGDEFTSHGSITIHLSGAGFPVTIRYQLAGNGLHWTQGRLNVVVDTDEEPYWELSYERLGDGSAWILPVNTP